MELMPNCAISLTYCLKYMRTRSGREKTLPISIMYFPKVEIGFTIILFKSNFDAKVRFFSYIIIKGGRKFGRMTT